MRYLKKVICLLALLSLLPAAPVFAVPANPDTITLHTVRVFQNIWETDDVLFVISYDIDYASEPSESAEEIFQMAIYDGTTLIQSRPLNFYQYNVHSIYFDATAAAANITWESSYVIRIMGNPAFFPSTEDVTMDSTTLASGHWLAGAESASRALLVAHCLDLAEDLETAWSLVLIVITLELEALNSLGRITFLSAIPALDTAVPELFVAASSTIGTTQQTSTADFAAELTIEAQLGSAIKEAFDGIGDYFNISGQSAAGMWIALFCLVIASVVFLNSGNTTAAIVLTLPIIILGTWVGAITMALLFTVAAGIIILIGYHIFLRGM